VAEKSSKEPQYQPSRTHKGTHQERDSAVFVDTMGRGGVTCSITHDAGQCNECLSRGNTPPPPPPVAKGDSPMSSSERGAKHQVLSDTHSAW